MAERSGSPRSGSPNELRRHAVKGREEMKREGGAILKERKRRIREALMKDMAKFEDSIVEPYLEVYNAAPADWLVRINERCQVVMQTNQQLQEQVTALEHKARVTELTNASKGEKLEAVTADVDACKAKQLQFEAQLQEVRQSGLLEEERLREQNVALHTKLSKLKRMNKRLEDQRRVDENLIARNGKVLQELRQMQGQLETLKAEYEMGEFSEHPALQKSRFSYQMGANTPSGEDRSQTSSPDQTRTQSERASLAEIPSQANNEASPYPSNNTVSQDSSTSATRRSSGSVKKRGSVPGKRGSKSGSLTGFLVNKEIPGL